MERNEKFVLFSFIPYVSFFSQNNRDPIDSNSFIYVHGSHFLLSSSHVSTSRKKFPISYWHNGHVAATSVTRAWQVLKPLEKCTLQFITTVPCNFANNYECADAFYSHIMKNVNKKLPVGTKMAFECMKSLLKLADISQTFPHKYTNVIKKFLAATNNTHASCKR